MLASFRSNEFFNHLLKVALKYLWAIVLSINNSTNDWLAGCKLCSKVIDGPNSRSQRHHSMFLV